MTNDVKSVGLIPHNKEVVDTMMERQWFRYQMDAAKFAMAVAINAGVEAGQVEGAETVWNVGTFDTDGELRSLIAALFPNSETPYRLIEYFTNVGLQRIERHLNENPSMDAADLIEVCSQPH